MEETENLIVLLKMTKKRKKESEKRLRNKKQGEKRLKRIM